MAQYGSGPQRGPMGQTLMGGLSSMGQRGIPGNAGLGQAALQRQSGGAVNMGTLAGASGTDLLIVIRPYLQPMLRIDRTGRTRLALHAPNHERSRVNILVIVMFTAFGSRSPQSDIAQVLLRVA